ncbi:MAG TPA: DUF6178 family protein [Thermodesulfobacteriota bacterium]|nr:DUF6178 family protein [Thermodesulfobacteriota bacterium]
MVDYPPLTLPEDPTEARKIFSSLPIKNQLDIVLRAHGKDRLHYLFLSEHPEQLVQQLPELEVFLTVKEVGENDSLDLLSLTTAEQFQYILDLDLWKRDQLDPEKVLHWMEILIESGDQKATQFIHSTDPEQVVLLLKRFLRVLTSEGEPVEVRDRLPLFTLDQHYFIDFKGKRVREIFQPFLEVFYRVDEKGYRRTMDSLIVELESDLEETGYRLRNGRLADYGFPDFEEALEIYSFVNPDSLSGGKGTPQIRDMGGTEKKSPTFYLAFQNEGPLLSSVLSRIGPRERDRLSQEITSLCNKAIVAEGLDLSNIAGMERVIRKVYHYLSLGLQYLSQEEEGKAFELVQSLPMQRLFQCGVSTTILLRRKAEYILKGPWFSGRQENLVLLDTPHFEKFEGILRKRPALYRDGVYEDFKSLQDIKETENFLEFVGTVVNFLRKELDVSPLELGRMDFIGCHPETWREMTLSTIFLTSLANRILKGTFQFEAIEQARLKDFLSRVFERDAQGKGVIKMEIKNGLRDWLYSNEQEKVKRQHLLAFQDFCLDLFEEQYGKIPPGEEMDPRFVKGLLVKK